MHMSSGLSNRMQQIGVSFSGCVTRQEVDQSHTTIIVIQLNVYLGTAMEKFSRAANWMIH
jgi:hypothetical protein